MTEIELDAAAASLRSLFGVGIVDDGLPPAFVHPLIHAVVLEDMPAAERGTLHRRAAEVLRHTGAQPDEIAAQLMQCEPAADAQVVSTLIEAAGAALAGGAPEAAVELLGRALLEPPERDRLVELERLRGRALLRARGAEGVDALRSAFAAAETPAEQAAQGLELARALESLTRNLDAVAVYQSALAQSDGGDEMQIRELEAGLAMAATQQSSTLPLAREVLQSMFQRPRRLDVADAIMRAIMAGGATMSRAVEGVAMAEAVLADGLIYDAEPSPVVGLALFPLVATDRMDAALAGWNEVIARAAANAQPLLLAFGLTFRGTTPCRADGSPTRKRPADSLGIPSAMWVGSAVPRRRPPPWRGSCSTEADRNRQRRLSERPASWSRTLSRTTRATTSFSWRAGGSTWPAAALRRLPQTSSSWAAGVRPGVSRTRRATLGARKRPWRCGQPTLRVPANWPRRR